MLLCMFCPRDFPDVKQIETHLRFCHHALHLGVFRCKQPGCTRIDANFYACIRHLNKEHVNHDVIPGVPGNDIDVENDAINFEDDVENEAINFIGNDVGPGVHDVPENDLNINNVVPVTLEDFLNNLYTNIQFYTAQLYSIPNAPRNLVDNVVSCTSDLISSSVKQLEKNVFHILSKCNCDDEQYADLLKDVKDMFATLTDPFEFMHSEYKRLQSFEDAGFFIKPEPFEMGTVDSYVKIPEGGVQLVRNPVFGQFVPPRKVLKTFLQLPKVLSGIRHYMDQLMNDKSGKISNFLQGELWKELKSKHPNKFILPLDLEFDDYEPDNALGSHKGNHSLGALYCHLMCLPPEFSSILDNIFLVIIFESKHKSFGNAAAFSKAIEELTFLEEEGISVTADGETIQVYFCFSLLIGDNLGINGIQGFIKGFRGNFFCRICKLHRNEMSHYCNPVPIHRLRNVQNYEVDVALQNSNATGIHEPCVWNEVPSYHCIVNSYCDVAHDIFEGTLRYDISGVLWKLVGVKEYLTIETLCERVEGFDYGPAEQGNRPPSSQFTLERLENCSLNLSASEMLCLARYLGEMIGDLVPEDCVIWKFYLLVREIVEIVTSPVFEPGVDIYLEILVKEHHEMYLLYFGPLKPKHHFMVHYGKLLRRNGSLSLISALLCERNHKKGKAYARVCNSRINPALSVAIKYQLYLCERLMRPENAQRPLKMTKLRTIEYQTLKNYASFANLYPVDPYAIVSVADSVEIYGTRYQNNMVLVVKVGSLLPTFGKIVHCIVLEDSVLFVVNVLKTVCYRGHICSYEVEASNEWVCVNHSELLYYMPLWHRTFFDGTKTVSIKHIL